MRLDVTKLIKILLIILIIYLCFLSFDYIKIGFTYLLGLLIPFVIGFGVSFILQPFINYLQRRGSTIHTLSKDNYLKTSKKFDELSEMLSKRFPNDFYAKRIAARQRLGALHILAKCNDYQTFKSTIVEDGYRRDMSKLLLCGNFKVFVISVVFCMSPRLFYLAAKTYYI